jgi:hypothetical protein
MATLWASSGKFTSCGMLIHCFCVFQTTHARSSRFLLPAAIIVPNACRASAVSRTSICRLASNKHSNCGAAADSVAVDWQYAVSSSLHERNSTCQPRDAMLPP